MKTIIAGVFMIWAFGVSAQNNIIINGSIKNQDGKPVSGVSVTVVGTSDHSVSDAEGKYALAAIRKDTMELEFTHSRYASGSTYLFPQKDVQTVDIVLRERINQLDEVVVNAETAVGKVRNQPLSVSVMETKNLSSKTVSNADILGTISGVNVRQNGGLGSDINFSINGMSGKQIRFFLDGIPLELYSSEMNIGSVPASFFSRFEVYKGTVPTTLASDALGGAVNMVSRDDTGDFMDFTYGTGSFNTHKLVINSRHLIGASTYLSFNGFANHSDNNYRIDADILDREGNMYRGTTERFHNKFGNFMVRPEIGVRNTSWADHAFISLNISGNRAELQHDALANQPYGDARSTNSSVGSLLRYRKQRIVENLDIDAYIVASSARPGLVDTSKNVYNWNGEVVATRNQGGELSASGNNLRLKDNTLSGQVNATYHVSPSVNITASVQQSYFRRNGSDDVVEAFYGRDYYSSPQSVDKTIGGLSLNVNLLEGRLISVTSAKYFDFDAKGYSRNDGATFTEASSKKENIGLGQAFSYRFDNGFSVKSSYEYATRLPTVFELFGDQMLILPNLSLLPETSHNFNVELSYRQDRINAQLNGFYRRTDDIIWQRPSSRYIMYRNLSRSSSIGIEGDIGYRILDNVRLGLNATYQDIRSRSDLDGDERYFDKRIPNIPYLFGNVDINYEYNRTLWDRLRLNVWYGMRYVNEFFLFWEVDGNRASKNVIPTQYSGNIGTSLTEKEGKYSLSIECQNMFNEKLYDNFRVQKPGRAFYLTLNYTIR